MPYINITEKVNNSVHTIFLNRPDRLNAWTEEMAIEIKQSNNLWIMHQKMMK